MYLHTYIHIYIYRESKREGSVSRGIFPRIVASTLDRISIVGIDIRDGGEETIVETRGLQVNYSPSWTRAIIRMPHGHSSFPSPRVSYTTSSSLRPPLDLRRFTLGVTFSPRHSEITQAPYLTFRFTITRIAYNCRCREVRRLYFAFEPPSTVP